MSSVLRLAIRITELLATLSTVSWTQENTGCDLNHDGKVDVVDVQLITNMEIRAPHFPCTANIGGVLGCSDAARQVVIKATLGKGCHFNFLTWNPVKQAGIVGYNVYRGKTTDVSAAKLLNSQGPLQATMYADVDAVTGTKYYYFVKPTDGSHEQSPAIEPAVSAK